MPLLDLLLPNKSADAVAVINQINFEQLFPDARPFKVQVVPNSKFMEHPLETGATITDHRVIQPLEIELSVFLTSRGNLQDYRSVYAQLKQAFDAADLLTIQTRTSSYPNMVIYEMPHNEDADMFDAVAVAVKLREVKYVEPKYASLPASQVADKQQSSTVARGEQQTSTASSQETSLIIEGYKSATNWWNGQ